MIIADLFCSHEWQNQEFRSICFTTIDTKNKITQTSFIILCAHSLFAFQPFFFFFEKHISK